MKTVTCLDTRCHQTVVNSILLNFPLITNQLLSKKKSFFLNGLVSYEAQQP